MLDTSRLWRQFLTSPWLQAGAMGLLGTILATALWALAPATYTALDWTLYDVWLSHRSPIPVSPALAIVTRDPGSEEEFGSGPWDRAVLAQFITAAHEAAALAIGLNHRVDHASPAQRGGAASDALFLEAMKAAAPVVVIQGVDPPLVTETAIFTHELVSLTPDHVSRSVPVTAVMDAHPVSGFGIALYQSFLREGLSERATGLIHT